MDGVQIENALQELALPYADRRLNVFEVLVIDSSDDSVRLGGRVLEPAQVEGLLTSLRDRFPGMQLDLTQVQALRRNPPRLRYVATNLTSLHNGTSFLAEQVSQLLNGWALEVLEEQGRWGFVRQMDGYLGWTYLPYLTDVQPTEPTHLVLEPVGLLRAGPYPDSALVTRVLIGTAVQAQRIAPGWVQVSLAGGWSGWLPEADLAALSDMPQLSDTRRERMLSYAFRLIGVPYLWGGCASLGIDCSGFVQLMHRLIGLTLPRDADMQCAAGHTVEPPFQPGDLLFFGEPGEQRHITHVGVSLGGWQMIHSSRSRNGVQVDNVQEVDHLRESYLCAASYLREPGQPD